MKVMFRKDKMTGRDNVAHLESLTPRSIAFLWFGYVNQESLKLGFYFLQPKHKEQPQWNPLN